MSESEGFLARWSRLKQESRREVVAGGDAELKARQSSPNQGITARPQGPEGRHDPQGAEIQSPPLPHVDLTTLPDIQSIGPDSDIRPFLQAGVPQELTGAALRSAWAADPAIRDFVEIADNQWDFNDESGIPGFGALGSADYARRLVARALEGFEELPPELPPIEVRTATPPAVAGPQIVDEVWRVGSADLSNTDGRPAAAAPAAEGAGASTVKRPHGTALPK